MPKLWTPVVVAIMTLSALTTLCGQGQSRSRTSGEHQPDFSGTWTLVEALVTGATRGSSEAPEPRRTSVNTISGAAFNCGRQCTIAQKGQTLTIENAQLAKDKTQPTPSLTLRLDGKQAMVVDTFSPARTIPATAKWQGTTLQIESRTESLAVNQSLSLEGARLVVVSVDRLRGERMSELTLKYAKSIANR
jgi:hypothetical protein